MGSQTDLDQGGILRSWVKKFLGPSVGYQWAPEDNVLAITAAGSYTLDLSISRVTVNVAGAVTITLPSTKTSAAGPQAQPGLSVAANVTVVDIGGNATAHPITVAPHAGETISGLSSISLMTNYVSATLIPSPIPPEWSQQGLGVVFGPFIVYNVKAYGAVGDGVTNDTVAIAAALTACAAAGGGVVYFPVGVYLISSTLTVPNGVSLLGNGGGNPTTDASTVIPTVIKWSSVSAGVMIDCDPAVLRYFGSIVGIQLNCNSHATIGLNLHAASGAYFRDIVIINCQSGGLGAIVLSQETYPFPPSKNVFEQVTVWNSVSGAVNFYGNSISGNVFTRCLFNATNTVSVHVLGGSDTNSFWGCDITCVGASGIAYFLDSNSAGAGNNNVYAGQVAASDGLGTCVKAGGNGSAWSHLYGVFCGVGTVINDTGTGHVAFHECLFPDSLPSGDYYPIPLATGAHATIPLRVGLVTISDSSGGPSTALYLFSQGVGGNLVSQVGTLFVSPTNAPGAGKVSLTYDGVSNAINIYNNSGSTYTFAVNCMKNLQN